MLSPMEKRANKPDKGIAGRKAEGSLAKRIGATTRPGSGALQGAKGDMTHHDFLIENKTVMHKDSFQMQKAHLGKIYQEALESGKSPALAFQFVNSQGQSAKIDRWVCLPESVFNELVQQCS